MKDEIIFSHVVKIPEQCRLPMTTEDIETGKRLLEADFITKNPVSQLSLLSLSPLHGRLSPFCCSSLKEWVTELKLMLSTKVKAEIQALSNFGFQYLTEFYLPQKIERGDWI